MNDHAGRPSPTPSAVRPSPRPANGRPSQAAADPATGGPAETVESPKTATPRRAPNARGVASHPAAHSAGMFGLALGALGVVYGDIGTSPLYAIQTVFSINNNAVSPDNRDVYGVISMVFWTITVVVSIKYVFFILRADNDGEGGVMALAALARKLVRGKRKLVTAALLLAVLGASLFYGDSVITPAISVLSAVEGLEVPYPGLHDAVLPIGIAILTVLFVVQRWGTHIVGRAFGPVMAIWFLVLAALGIPKIAEHPQILKALSPTYVGTFIADHPYLAFVAAGAVVLAITGAEALYADMGHFGRGPIRRAWFFLVFPCLVINYLGQGALITTSPKAVSNPFYLMAPHWAQIPLVVLATAATVIASQAVISGAYSVSRQAVRLGYLPHLTVRQTSTVESGQIYVPVVNWLVYFSVLALMLTFRSSAKLATAYGLAVTGTFLITTVLFLIVAKHVWRWKTWQLLVFGIPIGFVELCYFGANMTKVDHGGWLPLSIAVVIVTAMTTWQSGRQIVTRRRKAMEGPLQEFVDELHAANLTRVPGTAVFPHPSKETTPLALRANVAANHVLHEHVVLVSVKVHSVPYIPASQRIVVDPLVHSDDGVVHVDLNFGFQDEQDIPCALRLARGGSEELNFDPDNATYFISKLSLARGNEPGMAMWRKRIFIGMAHNAANPSQSFRLPEDRTIVMGAHLDL